MSRTDPVYQRQWLSAIAIAAMVFMAFVALIAIKSRHHTNADLEMHLSETAAASLGSPNTVSPAPFHRE
jgi:hypothetical protein